MAVKDAGRRFTLLIKTRTNGNPFDMDVHGIRHLCEAKLGGVIVLEDHPIEASGLHRVEIDLAPWRLSALASWFAEYNNPAAPAPVGSLLLYREAPTDDTKEKS